FHLLSFLISLYSMFSPLVILFFFLFIPPPPRSTLFPYTTLFRSLRPISNVSHASTKNPHGSSSKEYSPTLRRPKFLTGPSKTSEDRKSTRLNSSHQIISYAVFCLKKKKQKI